MAQMYDAVELKAFGETFLGGSDPEDGIPGGAAECTDGGDTRSSAGRMESC